MIEHSPIAMYGDVLELSQSKEDSNFSFSFTLKQFGGIANYENLKSITESLNNFYEICNKDEHKLNDLFTIVTGELIENAIKYSNDDDPQITYKFINCRDFYYIKVTNHSSPETAKSFKNFLKIFLNNDVETMIKDRILFNLENSPEKSQLGLLKLKKDFNLKLRVTIRPKGYPDHYNVVSVEASLQKDEDLV